jgi:hypothetical protein
VTNVYLPDANASSGLICNMIPFSSVFGTTVGAWSHLTIIPAPMLAAQGVLPGQKLVDIQFAPCGTGIVHIPNIQVMVGHLQNPLPTFSLLNGFADQTSVYDSTGSGTLSFQCVANTWSSMGIGGGNLAWDGMSDVGVYTTHSGLSISSSTGWQGSFWRDATMMRHYVNAYQATMALTSSLSGLKVGLVFVDPVSFPATRISYGQGAAGTSGVPILDAQEAPYFGNNAFGLAVLQARPGAVAVLMISTVAVDMQIGVGSDVHLMVDLSPTATSFLIPLPVNGFGTAFFPAPLPNYVPGLAGLTVFCQWAILGDPNGQFTIYNLPLAMTDGLMLSLGVF